MAVFVLTKVRTCSNNNINTKKGGGIMATAYCMKCRKKVNINSPKQITLKNGRPAVQGTCPSCGTKVFRIGKA